jgi:hypothetical protein
MAVVDREIMNRGHEVAERITEMLEGSGIFVSFDPDHLMTEGDFVPKQSLEFFHVWTGSQSFRLPYDGEQATASAVADRLQGIAEKYAGAANQLRKAVATTGAHK